MPRFAANLSMLFTEQDFLVRFQAAANAGFHGVDDQDERWVKALREDLLDVDVPLSATVARRQLRLRDILHMQPGDVIPIELEDELVMRANGVPSFKVKLGSHKGNLALQVVEPIGRR